MGKKDIYKGLLRCYETVRKRVAFIPEIALVLGSGLGNHGDKITQEYRLPYGEIEGFPVSTAPGHKGAFLFGRIDGVPVAAMQGRIHYYEGYAMDEVVLPIRLVKMLGAKVLFLTNAAGGINGDFCVGDFMLIRDHISSFVPSPLIGPNIPEMGPRFPDMSDVYDKDLREAVQETAAGLGIALKEGVYVQLTGPNFETPAEINMCRTLGADAVGMSTACEAMAAKHMGMKVCGISCISNLACGLTDQPLSQEEVEETADRVAPLFEKLLFASLVTIHKGMAANPSVGAPGRASSAQRSRTLLNP